MILNIDLNKYLNNLAKTDRIVVAVSGGVDSVSLLDVVLKQGYKVVIAHVNHHKRIESKMEQEYLTNYASERHIPIEVLDYHHEENNFQAEAHDKRYEFFYQVAKKWDARMILTAHHLYDNLETIIMNMIRGSNLYGYSGISESVMYQDILICRPFIKYLKEDIYQYAKENNLKYFEDSSNEEDDYLRNRIRHSVIPLLEKENPNLSNAIMNYSKQLSSSFEYIRNSSISFLDGSNQFYSSDFKKLPEILKRDVINYLFEQNEITSSENKIEDLISLIDSSRPNLTYDLGQDFIFVKSYGLCYIEKQKDVVKVEEEINKYDTVVIDGYGEFYFRKKIKESATDYIALSHDEKFPLTIRTRLNGDKLIIGDGHKKLKDFLIDKKVPKEERDNLLVVANNEGEIIWVLGYYKKKVMEIEPLNLVFERVKENA